METIYIIINNSPRSLITWTRRLLSAAAFIAVLANLQAEECDTCTHPTKVMYSETRMAIYDPGKPTVGPPKSTSQHGKWYNPTQYINVTTTVYYLDEGDWKLEYSSAGPYGDCYNDPGCGG